MTPNLSNLRNEKSIQTDTDEGLVHSVISVIEWTVPQEVTFADLQEAAIDSETSKTCLQETTSKTVENHINSFSIRRSHQCLPRTAWIVSSGFVLDSMLGKCFNKVVNFFS